MSIGGWLGEEREWNRLELQWEKCINWQNKKSRPDQQITRYHATFMNGYHEEFENWDKPMSERFCAKLLNIITRRSIGMVSCGVDMDAYADYFPPGDNDNKEWAYSFLIQNVMVDLGNVMREVRSGDQVMLVHDHGDWDATALFTYNKMMGDEKWESRHVFHSITSLTWKQSVGLQAADLAAYESYRVLKNKLATDETHTSLCTAPSSG